MVQRPEKAKAQSRRDHALRHRVDLPLKALLNLPQIRPCVRKAAIAA
jgi:hypothetical protein